MSKVIPCDLKDIGSRMRVAREHLGLTQSKLATQFGYSDRTYQKNETGMNEAGICLTVAFAQLGINANWLLTGEGPMLLADLDRVREVEKEVLRQVSPPINDSALAAILVGILQARGSNADPVSAVKQAVKFYHEAISEGFITPIGIGEGGSKAA